MATKKKDKYTVLGLGVSGLESALFLKRRGLEVFASELSVDPQYQERARRLHEVGAEVEIGHHSYPKMVDSDWVVISPGIKPSSPIFHWARGQFGDRLISEIELASKFCPGKIVAVTGTNGKSTVTSSIAALFRNFGLDALACGNLGNPFIGEIAKLNENSYAVVETSSFQLVTSRSFHPSIALLLNIRPDHLDWHCDFYDYLNAKMRIFQNQTPHDFAVFNERDSIPEETRRGVLSRILTFNKNGSSLDPNWQAILEVARVLGFPVSEALRFLQSHPGLEHRLERVPSEDGFAYINDSKSTNPASLEWALERMEDRVVLIAGGRNKGSDFRPLRPLILQKTKGVILIGESREEMKEVWGDGGVPILLAASLSEAIRRAREMGEKGDSVLFSPACASFDMFRDYRDRGEQFKKLVTCS